MEVRFHTVAGVFMDSMTYATHATQATPAKHKQAGPDGRVRTMTFWKRQDKQLDFDRLYTSTLYVRRRGP